jgi:uncharacterized protein with von Willebrand factor type A (vWA) domain
MNTINLDSYDKASFNNIKEQSSILQNMETIGSGENVAFPFLMEDVYGSLYKYSPEVKEEVSTGFQFNKQIIQQLMQLREYKDLREFTKLKEFESATGVQSFSEYINNNIPEETKQKINEAAITQTLLNGLLENYNPDTADSSIPNLVEEAKEKLNKLNEELQQKDIRKIIKEALKQSSEDVQQTNSFLNSFGTGEGQNQTIPMKDKIEIAKKLMNNSKLKQIATLAGRFQNLALHYQSTKTKHGVDEIVDIKMGNDINKIVPTELVYLDDPDLDIVFYDKLSQRKLLQFDTEGKENLSKGPIILCIDGSGSMTGDREVWSKAFALGLLTIAKKQKRDFSIIHFGSEREIKTYSFSSKIDPTNLLEALSYFFHGGTNFEQPLHTAVKLIKENKNMKKADIVFITDGECVVSEVFNVHFLENKEKYEFKIYGILIETSSNELPFPTDTVFKLNKNEKDDNILQQIYGGL